MTVLYDVFYDDVDDNGNNRPAWCNGLTEEQLERLKKEIKIKHVTPWNTDDYPITKIKKNRKSTAKKVKENK